jgi:alpha-D-ribose 1-methylphosphonate 5-triphosphate synthase subunit PhnG
MTTMDANISLSTLAKPGCRKCNGRGVAGHKFVDGERKPIACGCAVKNYAKVRQAIVRDEAKQKLHAVIQQAQAPWWKKLWWRIRAWWTVKRMPTQMNVKVTP